MVNTGQAVGPFEICDGCQRFRTQEKEAEVRVSGSNVGG